jgi:hypothetical protein
MTVMDSFKSSIAEELAKQGGGRVRSILLTLDRCLASNLAMPHLNYCKAVDYPL